MPPVAGSVAGVAVADRVVGLTLGDGDGLTLGLLLGLADGLTDGLTDGLGELLVLGEGLVQCSCASTLCRHPGLSMEWLLDALARPAAVTPSRTANSKVS